jgi:ketosteroid isomerase-like protein
VTLHTAAEQVAHEELKSIYVRARKAFKAMDAQALMDLVTTDFVQQMPDGALFTREQVEPVLRDWIGAKEEVTSYRIKLSRLEAAGETVTGIVDEKVKTRFKDPAGVDHRREQDNRSRVVWTKGASGWQISRSEYVTARLKIDGYAVRPLHTGP